MGYGYIDAAHAQAIQNFYTQHLNPYLNYHRPCAQADVTVDALQRVAAALSDTEAAQRMQRAKRKLFEQLRLAQLGPGK